ncbi:clasp1 cytoplasmic linker associated protein [Schistosoma japonicum]|uniref:Clasp1 cytoplasmic linker associated protein n=1 Tax=Schistosoma japonicum TaxID=6182 RepID=A0A4Z2CPZ9_SCHJA|nr:clasp1 cytoplasmic linker associated protein [Schistosoma japonicum]
MDVFHYKVVPSDFNKLFNTYTKRDSVFLKRRLIPYGLNDAVEKELNKLNAKKETVTHFEQSRWDTPIITPFKAEPRICGDHLLTLNPHSLQQSCTTKETESALYKFRGSVYFPKSDLKDAYLSNLLDEIYSKPKTVNTPFGIFEYKLFLSWLSYSTVTFQRSYKPGHCRA